MTVRIDFSREIEEREILRHLHGNVYRQGTDRAILVDCRNREEADLIVHSMIEPGVTAKILGEIRVS